MRIDWIKQSSYLLDASDKQYITSLLSKLHLSELSSALFTLNWGGCKDCLVLYDSVQCKKCEKHPIKEVSLAVNAGILPGEKQPKAHLLLEFEFSTNSESAFSIAIVGFTKASGEIYIGRVDCKFEDFSPVKTVL